MAFLTSGQISNLTVGLLAREVVLAGTVSSVDPSEFNGDNGDEVTIRVPQTRTARVQATPGAAITFDAINETSVTLSLTHIYDAAPITDEALSLEIEDFAVQVTAPQVESVGSAIERNLATAMNAVPADDTTNYTVDEAEAAALHAMTVLTQADVPMTGRYLAVSPLAAERLLASEILTAVDSSGNSSALRDATIGRLRGFTVVVSNMLSEGTAGLGRMVAYHRSGFAFTSKVPATPRGASSASTATYQGLSMRHIFQYDAAHLQDQSVVSAFVGSVLVDADRVYVVELAAAGGGA
jgi:hypothetical protein